MAMGRMYKAVSGNYVKPNAVAKRRRKARKVVTKLQLTRALNKNADRRIYRQANSLSGQVFAPTNISFDHMGWVQGDANGERSGNAITLNSFRIKGNVEASDNFNRCRVTIIQWMDDNVTPPALGEIFDDSYGAGATATYTNDLYFNIENKAAYRVLYDKRLVLGTRAGERQCLTYDIKIPKKKLHEVTYNSSGAVNGTGHVYVIFSSDSAIAPHPGLNYQYEVDYMA